MTDQPGHLVSTDWLDRQLGDPALRILDASWYLPGMGRDAKAEYLSGHIPGAVFTDIDAISDQTSPLPHMAPSAEDFAQHAAELGLNGARWIVVYDGAGLFSAARIWWLLRLMGLGNVFVLDGGLPKWRAEGRRLEASDTAATFASAAPQSAQASYAIDAALIRDADQVVEASRTGEAQILDARAAPRFKGEAAEPRPGLRAGHIPGARNLPFGEVLNADGTMKSPTDLHTVFAAAGVDLARPIITSCGSGVTAAVLSLALATMGHQDNALYDGSWAEWGGRQDLPLATGDA